MFKLYCDITSTSTSTSDVDAKNRIRSLNEFSKINLNAIRRVDMHDDGVFNDHCQLSDQEI